MKIAICINGRPHEGGMTTVVNEYAKTLRKFEHQVDVITIFGVSKFRETKPNLVSKGNKILKNRPIITCLVFVVLKIVLAIQIYINYFIKKYDIIFAMDFSVMNLTYPIKKLFGTKIVQVFFGGTEELIDQGKLKPTGWITNHFYNQQKKSFKKGDLLITSSFFLNKIHKLTKNTSPIYFVKSLVNLKNFYPNLKERKKYREKLKIDNKFVLLFAGRLDSRKGAIYPLFALQKLVKQGEKNFILLYAGQGEEEDILKKIVKENKLQNYVKLLGSVAHSEIVNLFRASDCFLFTSIKQSDTIEAVCISVLEAIASGLPVISFYSSESISQDVFLKDNENCLMIPEKNVDELIKAILKLYKNPDLTKKLVTQGQNDILNNGWTPEQIIKRILYKISKLNSF